MSTSQAGYIRFIAEAKELVDVLHHASQLIDETRSAIWEAPTGERAEIPGRVIVGEISDPTGDTAVDDRRIGLRSAVQGLIYDQRRLARTNALLELANQTLAGHNLKPAPRHRRPHQNDTARYWYTPRSHLLASIIHIDQAATGLNERDLNRIAHQLHHLNRHIEQRTRRAAIQFNKYNQKANT